MVHTPLERPSVEPMPPAFGLEVEAWANGGLPGASIGDVLREKLDEAWNQSPDPAVWKSAMRSLDPQYLQSPLLDLVRAVARLDREAADSTPIVSEGDQRRLTKSMEERMERAGQLDSEDFRPIERFSPLAFRKCWGPDDVCVRDDGTMALVLAGEVVDRLSGKVTGYEVVTRGGVMVIPPNAWDRWSFALPEGVKSKPGFRFEKPAAEKQQARRPLASKSAIREAASAMLERGELDELPRCLGGDPPVR